MASKIKKGDTVKIIAGKDKGKIGQVTKVFPELSQLIVSGVNIATKHQKPSSGNSGGLVKKEMPIHQSNVMFVDEKGETTRVGFRVENDKKVRFSKTSGVTING